MAGPVYQPVVTLGNILTIAVMAVAVFTAYSDLKTSDETTALRIATIQESFNDSMIETRRVRPEIELRLRSLESARAGDLADAASLRRDMQDLKNTMRELTLELRKLNEERTP